MNGYEKMREALENAHSLICEGIETEVDDEIAHPFHLELACEVIQKALSAPPRNCDVGTPKDQLERFSAFCDQFDADCAGCPCDGNACTLGACFAMWAQMPYEEGGAK